MNQYVHSLILGIAAATLISGIASADQLTDDSTDDCETDKCDQLQVINGQVQLGDVFSSLNVEVEQDDVTTTSAAIANSLNVKSDTPATVASSQRNEGDVTSWQGVTATDAGSVSASSAAFANASTVETNYSGSWVINDQKNWGDVTADLDLEAHDSGDVDATVAGVGNSLSVKAGNYYGQSDVVTSQKNGGDVSSFGDVTVSAAGNVSASSAAIGNSVNVTSKLYE